MWHKAAVEYDCEGKHQRGSTSLKSDSFLLSFLHFSLLLNVPPELQGNLKPLRSNNAAQLEIQVVTAPYDGIIRIRF